MANHGKRMVKENLIATVATETDIQEVKAYADTVSEQAVQNGSINVDKTHYFTALPGDYNGDMDKWFKDIPVLQTNGFTDADTFGHPVIEGNQNAGGFEYLDLAGTYIIRDTANNRNALITTYNQIVITAEDTASGKASSLSHFLCYRTGNNDWGCPHTRYQGGCEFRYMDSEQQIQVYATAVRLSRSVYFGFTTINASGIAGQSVDIRIGKLKANYNAAVATPTVEGSYLLKVNVDSNGEVDNISWVAEADYKNA